MDVDLFPLQKVIHDPEKHCGGPRFSHGLVTTRHLYNSSCGNDNKLLLPREFFGSVPKNKQISSQHFPPSFHHRKSWFLRTNALGCPDVLLQWTAD